MQAMWACFDLKHVGGRRDGAKRIELTSDQCGFHGTVGAKPNLLKVIRRQAAEGEVGSVFDVHGRIALHEANARAFKISNLNDTNVFSDSETNGRDPPGDDADVLWTPGWHCEVIGAFDCEERFVGEVAIFGFTCAERQETTDMPDGMMWTRALYLFWNAFAMPAASA